MTELSISALLAQRAQERPDAAAFTFVDYDINPDGLAETLTWSQLQTRVQALAAELTRHGARGDRAAILAPQSMEYIIGVLGAIEAGFIAVPLPVPMFGVHDERVVGALADSAPTVVLTTSASVTEVAGCVNGVPGNRPTVLEIDTLDLDGFGLEPTPAVHTDPALLQYTSGSTRAPAGVVVSHRNVVTNLRQMIFDHYEAHGTVPPADTTVVSWLPFYHDLGLQFGIFYPIVAGVQAVLMSPLAFLAKPARWVQAMAKHPNAFSGAPNFAFDLAARRTSDADLAGLDLGGVLSIASGAERVQAPTLRRFAERFAQFGLRDTVPRPGYGLAEATVYVSSLDTTSPPITARFDYEKLSAGYAQHYDGETGVEMVSNGVPRACTMVIVDPETRTENAAGRVGEIWVHGDNVCAGYWKNPAATERTFGGQLVNPSPGLPAGPWLRTGDLGVLDEGQLYIVGRIKDLLIVDGRNHYPDDIEATVGQVTGGRVAAICITRESAEELAVVAEVKKRGDAAELRERLAAVKRDVAAAVSRVHGVRIADLVLIEPGGIPITTSGKIRRQSCGELHRTDGFARVDADA